MIKMVQKLIGRAEEEGQSKQQLNINGASSESYIGGQDVADQNKVKANKVDVIQVLDAMKKGEQYIKPTQSGDHTVIFWGKSGKGKSTSVHLLSGRKVRSYFSSIPILIAQGNQKQAKEQGVVIGVDYRAETIFPAMLRLKTQEGKDLVFLWDMPGLLDNRGITQDLINCYFVHRIFQIHKQVKLFFTLDYELFQPGKRQTQLKSTLLEMMQVFGSLSNYQKSVALLITKVRDGGNQNFIIRIIGQIINKAKEFQENAPWRQFLSKVLDKQIPILLIKQPDIKGKKDAICERNAIDVSWQYQHLFDQAYRVIVQNLKPASLPRLNPPTIKKEEDIIACKNLVKSAEELINYSINRIIEQLPKFIKKPFQMDISVNYDFNDLEKRLRKCREMSIFVDKLMKIIDQGQSESNLKQNFDRLKILFQENDFQCLPNSKGKKECFSMNEINDKYIIAKFFNTFKFNQTLIPVKWSNQGQIIRQFFVRIIDANPISLRDEGNLLVHNKIQSVICYIFKQGFLQMLENQGLYVIWKENFKILPSFMKYFEIFDCDIQTYFQQLQARCNPLGINCIKDIWRIRQVIKLNQEYLKKPMDESKMIADIKSQVRQKYQSIILNATSFSRKTPHQLETNISRYIREKRSGENQQMTKLFKVKHNLNSRVEGTKQDFQKKQQRFAEQKKQFWHRLQRLKQTLANRQKEVTKLSQSHQQECRRIEEQCKLLQLQFEQLKKKEEKERKKTPQKKGCCLFWCFK